MVDEGLREAGLCEEPPHRAFELAAGGGGVVDEACDLVACHEAPDQRRGDEGFEIGLLSQVPERSSWRGEAEPVASSDFVLQVM